MLIARALLKKDANIFLIDEATSNLNPLTEQAFLKNFSIEKMSNPLLVGKTFIFSFS